MTEKGGPEKGFNEHEATSLKAQKDSADNHNSAQMTGLQPTGTIKHKH